MWGNGGKSESKKCGKIWENGSQKTLENTGTLDLLESMIFYGF